MKAYVIKNKEGKYFVNRYVQAKKIYNAFIFEDKNDAEQVKGEDDEVVEITIAEGDLEQQLAEKDKEIEKYISALEYNENNLPNQRQAIRHQVCKEIRDWYRKNDLLIEEWLKDCLDQIEQGENDAKN